MAFIPCAVAFHRCVWVDFRDGKKRVIEAHTSSVFMQFSVRYRRRQGRCVFDQCIHRFSLECCRGCAPAPSVCALYRSASVRTGGICGIVACHCSQTSRRHEYQFLRSQRLCILVHCIHASHTLERMEQSHASRTNRMQITLGGCLSCFSYFTPRVGDLGSLLAIEWESHSLAGFIESFPKMRPTPILHRIGRVLDGLDCCRCSDNRVFELADSACGLVHHRGVFCARVVGGVSFFRESADKVLVGHFVIHNSKKANKWMLATAGRCLSCKSSLALAVSDLRRSA